MYGVWITHMRLLFAVLAAALLFAAPARAAGPELGIADDRVLLAGGPEADRAVAEWTALGVQTVRIYALWNRIAPSSPAGADDWSQLDAAVNRVVAAGMKPILTITGPGPRWVSRRAGHGDGQYDPDPQLFGDFASAVATRYGDRVDRYVVWNEPNLNSWLAPQGSCSHGRCTAVAPHLYRGLVRAAYPKIHAADANAQVLIGAMSSRGGSLTRANSTEHPLAFLRELGCVTTKLRKTSAGRCKRFKAVPADGFAFHPHSVLLAPEKAFPNPDDVSLAALPRLTRVLDRLTALKRISGPRKLNLYLDEYGYQTDPPDVFSGVSLAHQDDWLQRAAYL